MNKTGRESHRYLLLTLLLILPLAGTAASDRVVTDPVKAKTASAPLLLKVDLITTIPARSKEQHSRINKLSSAFDRSGHLYINDMNGRLYRYIEKTRGMKIVLDLEKMRPQHFTIDGEHSGLIDIAFHPDFENPGTAGYLKLYSLHTEKPLPDSTGQRFISPSGSTHHDDVLAEWRVDPLSGITVPSSFRQILRIAQPQRDRNTGSISFNHSLNSDDPDYDYLFIGVGDGGSGDHKLTARFQQGQNPGTVFGKILRINPTNPGDALPYTIPVNNPFIDSIDHRPEIWASGFRYPIHMAWNKSCVMIHDQGHQTVQEINAGKLMLDYGWPETQGSFKTSSNNPFELLLPDGSINWDKTAAPAYQYDQDDGTAISQGAWFRNPFMHSNYLFADRISGRIFLGTVNDDCSHIRDVTEVGLSMGNKNGRFSRLTGAPYRAELFLGQNEAGNVFLLSQNTGQIWHISDSKLSGVGLSGWVSYQDDFKRGSAAKIIGPNAAFLPLHLQLTKSADIASKGQYAYSGIIAGLSAQPYWKSLLGHAGIEIQYRSSGEFNLLLTQPGTPAGQEHSVKLASTAGALSRTLAWKDFVQPGWVKNKTTLHPGNVVSIQIQLGGAEEKSAEIVLFRLQPSKDLPPNLSAEK